jgi:hypothetical protein
MNSVQISAASCEKNSSPDIRWQHNDYFLQMTISVSFKVSVCFAL